MKVVLALDEKGQFIYLFVVHISTLDTGIFDGEKFHLANCMSTLTIFCKVKPRLMLKHATTLQPYLSTQCTVSSILELIYFLTCMYYRIKKM